jgi:hypothetical protein
MSEVPLYGSHGPLKGVLNPQVSDRAPAKRVESQSPEVNYRALNHGRPAQ